MRRPAGRSAPNLGELTPFPSGRPRAPFDPRFMADVEVTSYGYRVTFDSKVQSENASRLQADLRRIIRPREGGFGMLIDLRKTRSFTAEAQELIKQTILICRDAGMGRQSLILHSAITALQVRRMVKETGIALLIRYFDAATLPDWEPAAIAWIVDGAEPEGSEDPA
jgi:hypothetical protein